MEVTVTDSAIESVEVTEHQETTGIGAPLLDSDGNVLLTAGEAPIPKIPAEIVAQQSVKVDTVAGAHHHQLCRHQRRQGLPGAGRRQPGRLAERDRARGSGR